MIDKPRRSKRYQQLQHANRLLPSYPDHVGLARAVEEKFLDLCGDHLRIRGTELAIPESMKSDALRWRTLRLRHTRSDFRHTEAEWQSTCEFAQWTLDVHSELKNQPKKTFDRIPA